MTYHHIA